MLIPVSAICLSALLAVSNVMAEEQPDMDFFLFLADFTDDMGDWDAPELDETQLNLKQSELNDED